MLTVSLIRHGQSQANAGLATPDPANVALTALGHQQAKQVAAFLKKYRPLNLIITSPYLRTKQTASYTRELFPTTEVEEWDVQEFTFLASLHNEQSTAAERKPIVDLYWEMSEPSLIDGTYPYILSSHSESFKSFIGRVQACIRRLKEADNNKYRDIAIFSHEHFIIAALWYILYSPSEITSASMHDFRHFFKQNRLPNGGIVELKYRRSHDEWRQKFIQVPIFAR